MTIHLISGPRNISTALMYSFSQREDTKVVDEPFYAYFLNKTGVDHPGRGEILSSQPQDSKEVVQGIIDMEKGVVNLFLKNMSKHLVDVDLGFCGQMKNVFLIRDPTRLIASFSKVISQPEEYEIGLKSSWDLFCKLNTEENPAIVLNSEMVLSDPELGLKKLCTTLGIGFDANMLKWPAGPIPEDGVWAPYWYAAVHMSTGFNPPTATAQPSIPSHLKPLLEEVMPYYLKLNAQSLTLD